MVTFREAVTNSIRNAFCSYLGLYEGFLNSLPSAPPPVDDLFPEIPIAVTRFTRRLLCNREPPEESNPPFTGGQCPTLYAVRVDGVVNRPPPLTPLPFDFTIGNVLGAITVARVTTRGDDIVFEVLAQPNVPNPDGDYTEVLFANAVPNGFTVASWFLTGPNRQDGLPDDCGNPLPPVPTPPQPSDPIEVPVEWTDEDDNVLSITIPVIFAPVRVDIDGTLNVPFKFDIDPTFNVNFNGTININTGDINFNFGNQNTPPSKYPGQDDYQSPDDVPDYPPDVPNGVAPIPPAPPEDETTSVIRAVIVTVTDYASNATIIDQAENPDIYAPNLGFVQFAISVKNAVAWTSDIPVKNFRNFIPCPWEGGALEVRGTPRPGVTWTLSPVRIAIEEPVVFS